MAAYYNEIDRKSAAWLRELIARGHIAPGVVDERDIRDVTPDELRGFTQCHFFAGIGVWSYALRVAGWPDERPVWTGSCPCQPFSAAGGRGGFADERHLWPFWHWHIRHVRPQRVFGEQVASKDGLAWFDLVQSDLEGTGYTVGAADLCAAGVGAPHIRQRLWFVAHAASERHEQGGPNETVPRPGAPEEPKRFRDACGVADANGGDASAERKQRSGQQRQQPQDSGVGNPDDAGLSQRKRDGQIQREKMEEYSREAAERGSDVSGFWQYAEWIDCTDRKARPIEPGTFPLAHGAPARVGRLRGYGNAIVAQAAENFMVAAEQAIAEMCGEW